MAVHRPITTPGIYYITFTCFHWLPLIALTNAFNLIYNWFDILAAKGHAITGYVIMPNHVHLILYFSGGQQSLNTVVGNGKRFIAYKIVELLRVQNQTAILKQLTLGVRAKDKSRGKKHEVWQDTFDVKECRTEKFILQKLHYIHNNPCAGKWRLAAEPHQYPHSSCSFYLNGKSIYFRPRDYRDFLGMYDIEENSS